MKIETPAKSEGFQSCLKVASRYLNYRPRSENELREKLRQSGFDNDTQEAVITWLKSKGMVNDTAFARFWKQNRELFSPRSRWLTRLELKRKGLTNDIIEPIVATIDDDECAYQAALSKARTIPTRFDYPDFCRRLGDYLKRRGFNEEVIKRTVARVWQEKIDDAR